SQNKNSSPDSTRIQWSPIGLIGVNQKRTQESTGPRDLAERSSPGSAESDGALGAGRPARTPLPPGLRLLATTLLSEIGDKRVESPLEQRLGGHLQHDHRQNRLTAVAHDLRLGRAV